MSNGSWIVVAFITLDFQRIMEKRPELSAQIEDVSGQLAHMERLAQEAAEGEMPEDSPDLHELRTMLATLQSQAEVRSEEHTSELQSLMRISYAVFCLKKKKKTTIT